MRRDDRACSRSPSAVAIGHYIVITGARATPRCAIAMDGSCARRCATARSKRSSASGTSGTTTSRGCTRSCWRRRGRARPGDGGGGRRAAGAAERPGMAAALPRTCRRCSRAAVITLVLSCLAMALAVALGMAIATGRVYGGPRSRAAADGLRRGHARHAGAAAALRHLLRPRRRRPAAGVRRGAARARPQLRGLRERDLPQRARGGAARPARGGAHPRPHRAADAAAGARAAGVPPRAGADDQRLRRAAQGLVAGLGDHRRRADQADADLRHQHRQLGGARAAVRGALPGDVAAARAPGAAARSSAGRLAPS